MSRKVRYPLATYLLLLVGLSGATHRQIRQAQLNQDLITALWNEGRAAKEADRSHYALKALAALKAGADPNSWAYIHEDDEGGQLETPSLRWHSGDQKDWAHMRKPALMLALFTHDLKLFKALLDRGANLHANEEPLRHRMSLLGNATVMQQTKFVSLLLDYGADINEMQNDSKQPVFTTPLMMAAGGLDYATVRLLIQRGAKVNLRSIDHRPGMIRRGAKGKRISMKGQTALGIVLEEWSYDLSDKRFTQMVQILEAAGAKK